MNYKDLEVWKASMDLASLVYELTSKMPGEEKFGMISQMRRCSVSVPSNIAEGCGRSSHKQLSNFLDIANGSLFELETQLILSKKVKLIASNESELMALNRVRMLIAGFNRFIENQIEKKGNPSPKASQP